MNNYSCWNIVIPAIPCRSYFYSLKPVGIKNFYVESLTSYLTRLAASHRITPYHLLIQEIVPRCENSFWKKLSLGGFKAFFNCAKVLNSTGRTQDNFIEVLQYLTLSNDLQQLTLKQLRNIIPPRELSRSHKAYCPFCYQDWQTSGQCIYEPLLWTINAVEVCPLHRSPLHLQCFYCHQKIPLLTWNSYPGFCSNCHQWLGSSLTITTPALPKHELQEKLWIAQSVGELLVKTSYLSEPFPQTMLIDSLNALIDVATKGNAAAFARQLRIPKNTLWGWRTGESLPQLNFLLKICYSFKISLVDFLYQNFLISISAQSVSSTPRQPRLSPKSFEAKLVEESLLSVLDKDEQPPPTLKEISQYLGHDQRTITRHFPELCRAISAKYLNYKKQVRQLRLETACQQVQNAVTQLRREGFHPSEARVARLLDHPGYLRYKSVRKVLHQAQQETTLDQNQ